jgi:hypothetical protein
MTFPSGDFDDCSILLPHIHELDLENLIVLLRNRISAGLRPEDFVGQMYARSPPADAAVVFLLEFHRVDAKVRAVAWRTST